MSHLNAKTMQAALELIAQDGSTPEGRIARRALHDATFPAGVMPQPMGPAFTHEADLFVDVQDRFRRVRSWFNHGHYYKSSSTLLSGLIRHWKQRGGNSVGFSDDYRRVIVRAVTVDHSVIIATYDVSYAPEGDIANVMLR
jgi:hypothetical protein